MRTDLSAAAIAGPFVAQAFARGVQAPVRLLDENTHGWTLIERHSDTLCVDEFGDLWWARRIQDDDYRVVRACWPEEAATLAADIRNALTQILQS